MAKTSGNEGGGKRFVMVETAAKTTGKNRDEDGGLLRPSGRFALNANGSDLWLGVLAQTKGIDPGQYVVKFGVDEAAKLVAAYPVAWGTPAATNVRLAPRSGAPAHSNVTLYLDGVFEEYPKLRPVGNRKVRVRTDVDADGRPYLEISLQTQLSTRTVARSEESAAAAKDQPTA